MKIIEKVEIIEKMEIIEKVGIIERVEIIQATYSGATWICLCRRTSSGSCPGWPEHQ